ncbi:MAG: RHS repeat-associated core domain-containing protein [Candidatus Dormibacter sp.]
MPPRSLIPLCEGGEYYLRARYYDPATAQFLSRDPAVVITRSPYGYVGGNPLNGTDPGGECGLWGSDTCLGDAAGWVNNNVVQPVANAVNAAVSGSHTVGVCASVTASGTGFGGTTDVCGVVHFEGLIPVGVGTTETLGGGGSVGAGITGTLGLQVSNAQCISSLGGPFAYATVNGGDVVGASGEVAAGVDRRGNIVGVGTVGLGAGAGIGGQVGLSNTWTQSWLGW